MPRGFLPLLDQADRHVAERFSYGVDTTLAQEVRAAGGGAAWFEQQLTGLVLESPRALTVATWFPQLDLPAPLVRRLQEQGHRTVRETADELVARTFALRTLTRRHVHETMVDFWSNLLYVPAGEGRSWPWRADYDRVVRQHALGSFSALLKATVTHPAMTGYLTNDLNRRGAINENLGREVLELHTVGREAGYSERQVVDSSKILTGFTLDDTTTSRAGYDPERHATGRVRVLDFTHRNADADGRAVLDAYLEHLALHPATARRLARRLAVRFVSDDPPRGLVKDVARAYRRSGSDIPSTLRALAAHPAFRRARWEKTRNPSDDVVHMARVLGLRPTGALDDSAFVWYLVRQAATQGQVSFRWPTPDGWPEDGAHYLSASRVLRAWRSRYDVSGTSGPVLLSVDVPTKSSQLPSQWPLTLAQVVDHQSQLLLGRAADKPLVRAVARTLGHWIGRARSTFNHLKSELEREAVTQDMQERM
ncbi:DUF1800 family protein, partial [uncultured Nocardioides sp.]|uniref:DUF1800 family protein n=1 Tax=uncultured Nocardioides sp. TaxID=198441 RepID=UPI0026113FDA